MDKSTFQGYSILIIDDDQDIREIYATTFKNVGFTTYTAADGNEGLQQAREHHPSIIILDLMMPNKDGRTTLQELKAESTLQPIPVVIFSALITELERDEMISAGAADYIEKSDVEDPDQLVAHVAKVLGVSI